MIYRIENNVLTRITIPLSIIYSLSRERFSEMNEMYKQYIVECYKLLKEGKLKFNFLLYALDMYSVRTCSMYCLDIIRFYEINFYNTLLSLADFCIFHNDKVYLVNVSDRKTGVILVDKDNVYYNDHVEVIKPAQPLEEAIMCSFLLRKSRIIPIIPPYVRDYINFIRVLWRLTFEIFHGVREICYLNTILSLAKRRGEKILSHILSDKVARFTVREAIKYLNVYLTKDYINTYIKPYLPYLMQFI